MWLFSEVPNSRSCDEFSERLQIVLFTLGDLELNAVYDTTTDVLHVRPAYPGGKSWDEVPGQMGSGKKFHRNVISGADFRAYVRHVPIELEVMARGWESLNAKADVARVHRDGHCLEEMMWQIHAGRELPKGDDPRTDQSKGVHSYLPGWQPKETAS